MAGRRVDWRVGSRRADGGGRADGRTACRAGGLSERLTGGRPSDEHAD